MSAATFIHVLPHPHTHSYMYRSIDEWLRCSGISPPISLFNLITEKFMSPSPFFRPLSYRTVRNSDYSVTYIVAVEQFTWHNFNMAPLACFTHPHYCVNRLSIYHCRSETTYKTCLCTYLKTFAKTLFCLITNLSQSARSGNIPLLLRKNNMQH